MTESHFEIFTLTLTSILKSIKKIKDSRMKKYGLRGSHVMLLYQLSGHPEGLTPADLSESGCVDKALISRTISELLDKGFVRTVQTDGKKYKVRLCLTESGQETAAYIAEAATEVQTRISHDFTEEEMTLFYRILTALQIRLNEITEEEN